MKNIFYVKSLRSEFDGLQTLIDDDLVTTQTTDDIFATFTIKPNTRSFGRPPRLCTTILDENYLKTYRPQGIIFTLPNWEKPDYIFPFDLNAITENNDPVVEYYDMGNEVHLHYNVKLVDDFMEFAFLSYEEMYEKLKNNNGTINPLEVLELVNSFRKKKGLSMLDESKKKLVEYNEAIFLRPVRIQPIAIFGDVNNILYKSIAEKYKVPHYQDVRGFWETYSL